MFELFEHSFRSFSVRWGGDENRSSEEAPAGEAAADAVDASRPEKIHQVSLSPQSLAFMPHASHSTPNHDESFRLCSPFGFFYVCLYLCLPKLQPPPTIFLFCLSLSSLQESTHLPLMWLFCFSALVFSLPSSCFSFPPFFPSCAHLLFIPAVSADLLLLGPTCQDHRDQLSTTRWHLSSRCISPALLPTPTRCFPTFLLAIRQPYFQSPSLLLLKLY